MPDYYTYFWGNDQFTYLAIPKCASTSMRVALQGDDTKRKHEIRGEVFTIFRDVFSRCRSIYSEMKATRRYRGGFNDLHNSFDDYLTECEKGFWDEHQVSQIDYIMQFLDKYEFNDDDLLVFDFDDMDKVEKFLGVELPHMNKRKWFDVSEYATRIRDLYMEDWFIYSEMQKQK